MNRVLLLSGLVVVTILTACTTEDPLYCENDTDCQSGFECEVAIHTCKLRPDGTTPDQGKPDLPPDLGPPDVGILEQTVDLAPDLAPDLPPLPDGPAQFPLGSPCSGPTQCASGFCAGNVCCDQACTGACQMCTAATVGKCTPKPNGTACGAAPKCTGSTLVTNQCNGTSPTCQPKSTACAPYTCDTTGTKCRTSCTAHAQCTTGMCELFDVLGATLNTCIASQVCYAKSTATCPGQGTLAAPHCMIQSCLDKGSAVKYVVVADGTYSESLTVKGDVEIVATGTTGTLIKGGIPQTGVTKVTLKPTTGDAITAFSSRNLALHGMAIITSTGDDPVSYEGIGSKLHIRSCDIKGTPATKAYHGIDISSSPPNMANVTLQDVAVTLSTTGVNVWWANLTLDNVGIGACGGALATWNVKLTLRDVLVAFNGSGIQTYGSDLDFDRVKVGANSSDGLQFGNGSKGRVVNTLVNDNVGIGVYLHNNSQPLYFVNVTVVNNAREAECNSTGLFYNSIVYDIGASTDIFTGSCSFDHSQVKGGAPGTGNILTMPSFTLSGSDQYLPLQSSTGVDYGDDAVSVPGMATLPAKDVIGNPRKVKKWTTGRPAIVDMGAYEVQ